MTKLSKNEREKLYSEIAKEFLSDDEISMAEICKRKNISYASFYKYMHEKGLNIKKKKRKLRKIPNNIQELITEYQNDRTASLKSLAEKYSVCYQTVSRWLNRLGMQIRHPKQISEEVLKDAAIKYDEINNVKKTASQEDVLVGKHTLREYLKSNGLLKKKIEIQKDITYDKDFFETIDSEEKAYWLGFIFADGSIDIDKATGRYRLTIEIQRSDEKHLEKFKKSLKSNKQLKYRTRHCNLSKKENQISYMASIQICCKKIAVDLLKYGCIPNKTYVGYIDNIPNSVSLKAAFLRGYIDGDGHIAKPKDGYIVYISVHNKDIMNSLKDIMLEISGINPIIEYRDSFNGQYRIYYSKKKDFFAFLDIIYKDATIYLDRKYKNYLEQKKRLCRLESTCEKILGSCGE